MAYCQAAAGGGLKGVLHKQLQLQVRMRGRSVTRLCHTFGQWGWEGNKSCGHR
jgi:hypothetical protein